MTIYKNDQRLGKYRQQHKEKISVDYCEKLLVRYRHQHKEQIATKVPSTFAKVFPIKPQPNTELMPSKTSATQHLEMPTPPGLEGPLQALEFPLPEFRPLSRKEERTIAKKNQI